jgi:hypothetical protein
MVPTAVSSAWAERAIGVLDWLRLIADAEMDKSVGAEHPEFEGAEVRRFDGRRGVILTTGGYEYDEELKLNYIKGYAIYFHGNPGNTGDSVRIAQGVGAALWHMTQMIGCGIAHFDLAEGGGLNCLVLIGGPHDYRPGGYIITDRGVALR